jgi:hypothetical protein
MSTRRLRELGTMLAIGDEVIALVAPRRHSFLPVEVQPRRLQAGQGAAERPALVTGSWPPPR